MIDLFALSRAEGRALWSQAFPDCEFPRLTTKWFEARKGRSVVGWCCYRYIHSSPTSEATLISEGVYVETAFRGFGLQNEIREAMLDKCRTKRSKRKILVQTYVNAENLPSLKNAVRAGLVPYKCVRENASVFIHLEGKF
jgi:L-amino acid N-acyltransferase YncA